MDQERASCEVRDLVVQLCGTAVSSPDSQAARIQAYVAIVVCGDQFQSVERVEQEALCEILESLEIEFGWPTERARTTLKRGWGWQHVDWRDDSKLVR